MKKFLRLKLLLYGFLITSLTFAQERTISGRVTSAEDGSGLPGVNVILKGTSTGTITNVDGSYSLTIPSSGTTLVFTFIGLATQEIEIGSRSVIDVQMKADVTELQEVIVTGSAVGKSQKTLSFSVGKIDGDAITTVPSANFGTGLQGKVSGLRVNNVSGQPGQGAFFQIRSATSIANGQQPLIIVDGIFLNGSTLADINPEDVERVEVLKGSAAASLYGSQAANGVIQIFTKRGRALDVGKTSIIYRGEFGMQKEINRYDVNNFTNLTVTDPSGPAPILGAPSADNIHNTPLPNLHDYQDEILFRTGNFFSHYLAVQGRTESTNFLVSGQRLTDEGIIQLTDGFERNSFRLNVDHRISDKLDVQVSSMYSTSEQDLLAPTSNGPSSYIATILFLTPMFDLTQPNQEDGSPFDWDIDNTGLGTTNPLYDRANSDQSVNRTRLLGNVTLNYDITDFLSINYSAAVDRSTNNYEQFLKKGYLSTNIPGLFGTLAIVGQNLPGGGTSNGGGIHRSSRINNSLISRLNLVFQKQFGEFNTAVRASYLYEDLSSEFNEAIGENLAVAGLRTLDNAQNNIFIASETQQIVANSFFVIADIDYSQKYIFSGLFRREGSSLFGPEERWSNYFRVSGAYRLTEDLEIPGFQELKVRAAFGTAGVRPTFEQRFETRALINGQVQSGGTIGNNFLKPAQSREIEIGLNATFLNHFNMEFNYSDVETEDQILLVPLPGATGFDGQWQNAGTLEGTIYEASLNVNLGGLLQLNDFSWSIGANFDKVEQKIAKLNVPAYNTGPGVQQSTLFLIKEGIPFGSMEGQVFATSFAQLADQEGVDPNDYTFNNKGYLVLKSALGTPNENPYKLVDAAGNPITQIIGDINPDFRMGISNTFGYKGIEVYSLFDWKNGGDIYNMAKHWMFRDRRSGEVSDDPFISDSFYGSDGLYNVLVANNHFVEDGSFFMLRELAVSYSLPPNILENIFGGLIKGAKVSFVGRNLFTITDYTGFHPDITAPPRSENTLTSRFSDAVGSDANTPNGDPSLFILDSFAYPVPKTFSGSIQLTF